MRNKSLVAACAFEIQKTKEPSTRIQLMPATPFRGVSGRPHDVPHWFINPKTARVWLDQLSQRQTPLVIDYEHASLTAAEKGVKAPAAARFQGSGLELDKDGLWATGVEWTGIASAHISAGEYLFISPVFTYDRETGEITGLINAALTNTPDIDGMQQVLAAASQFITTKESNSVDQIRKLLGLPEGALEDDIVAAIEALQKQVNDSSAAVAAATQKLQSGNTSLVQELQSQVVALSQQVSTLEQSGMEGEATRLVDKAISDGKMAASQREWGIKYGTNDIAALTQFIDAAPPVVPTSNQSNGDPDPESNHGLDKDQLALCSQMGISAAEYAKQLKEDSQ
jgi:phage I-like protein